MVSVPYPYTLIETPEDLAKAGVDWARVVELYRVTRFEDRDPEQLRTAYHNSYAVVIALDHEGQVLGAARAVSDGVYHATVIDVAVRPDLQKRGLGRVIVETLLARLPFQRVYLVSTPGNQGFYEKFGFHNNTRGMSRYGVRHGEQSLEQGLTSTTMARTGEVAA